MSLAIQTEKVVIANFSDDKIQLLKNTVCKGASDSELQLFMHVCSRTGLDPFQKQIYAIPRRNKNKSGGYDQTMTIQTGIDGFRLIAERTGRYAPGREPSYQYDQQGKLISATAYVKKQTLDGTWHEVSATAFWAEYVQKNYDGTPSKFWQQMPHGQLAKCAESLGLRKAFPGEFSSLYSTEEMGQANNPDVKNDHQNDSQIETVTHLAIEEIQPDLKPEEILSYIDQNWHPNQVRFKEWMEEMMKNKEWSARKCIETFEKNEKHKEHTKKTFDGWLMNKIGM